MSDAARDQIAALRERMGTAIIGQRDVSERLLIGLLANGNLMVEGLPGLAKTRAIKALAKNLECDFSRIQFTPDLLPSDVTGTEVYYQSDSGSEFRFEQGPIFANIVLADEINRAPAKVQAALLEAMAAGCPVAGTDVGDVRGSLPESAREQIVPVEDEARLADALGRLLGDPALRTRLADEGLAHVRTNYSLDAMLEAYERSWRGALAR